MGKGHIIFSDDDKKDGKAMYLAYAQVQSERSVAMVAFEALAESDQDEWYMAALLLPQIRKEL